MPTYDFECKKCKTVYEEYCVSTEPVAYKGIKCPNCKSKSKTKLISSGIGFSFSNPVGTDRWNNEATGHDYRFRHNLPNVLKQREAAERNSKVGPTPYRKIDDISSGNNFGEVK